MKRILYILFVILIMASCKNSVKDPRLATLDSAVKPGDDFFGWVNNDWIKNNPIPAEYGLITHFINMSLESYDKLHGLVKEAVAVPSEKKTHNGQCIADIYTMYLDSARRDMEGVKPLMPYFEKIDHAATSGELQRIAIELQRIGVSTFFNYYIDADETNSSMNILSFIQGGLSLPQKDYYEKSDTNNIRIQDKFKEYVQQLLEYAGYPAEKACSAAATVLDIETRIADAWLNTTEQRIPELNYHKIGIGQLEKEYGNIDWNTQFDLLEIKENNVDSVNLAHPKAFAFINRLVKTEPLENLKEYVKWHVLNSYATYLDSKCYEMHFDFYSRTLQGADKMKEPWLRAVMVVDDIFGEALGQLYVQKYFPASSKEKMEHLVANLKKAFAARLENEQWMSAETRSAALEKLDAFRSKIGYPEKVKDYSKLQIDASLSLAQNIMSVNAFLLQDQIDLYLGKPVDPERWYMTPQTINAYYQPTSNEICFPAGILQYPFFDGEYDAAFNYGAIGVVIGHEMSHGFDDQGCQYDKNGNLNNWWTDSDKELYNQRIDVLRNFENGIEVLPGLFANGSFTLGENVADLAGMTIAYDAFQLALKENPLPVIDGFTPQQRFFISYAGVWASSHREQEIRRRVITDPHQLGRWRVNGIVPQIDAWYAAFDISPEDALYIEPDKRARIW